MTTTFEVLPVAGINPDPNQPRKTFTEEQLKELAASMASIGVLQPILVVDNAPKGYTIVYGERRWRAAQSIGMTEIPAQVITSSITDDEIRELQITENTQRSQVHPMEEAFTFGLMARSATYGIISGRIGKSKYYVKQRIQLNNLLKEFQQFFLADRFDITYALAIAQLSVDSQTALLEAVMNSRSARTGEVNFNQLDHKLLQLHSDLKSAIFDPEDSTLVPAAGACTTCPFNTAVATLFPEDSDSHMCKRIACFKGKSEAFMQREIARIKEDVTTVFVNDDTYNNFERPLVEKLEAEGQEVLVTDRNFVTLIRPQLPTLELFTKFESSRHSWQSPFNFGEFEPQDEEQKFDSDDQTEIDLDDDDDDDDDDDQDEDNDSQQEDQEEPAPTVTIEEQYAALQIRYDYAIKNFNEQFLNGLILKGFVVAGNRIGKYVYGRTRAWQENRGYGSRNSEDLANDKRNREAVENGTATEKQILGEIARISTREKRALELDSEKIHAEVQDIFTKSEIFTNPELRDCGYALDQTEILAAMVALFEAGTGQFKAWMRVQFLGEKKKESYHSYSYSFTAQDYEKLAEYKPTDLSINECLWHFMHEKLVFPQGMPIKHGVALALHNIAARWEPAQVAAAEAKQQEKTDKRNDRLNARIAQLNKQIEKLKEQLEPEPEAKPEKKKKGKVVLAAVERM